jgi:hypothetical protein
MARCEKGRLIMAFDLGQWIRGETDQQANMRRAKDRKWFEKHCARPAHNDHFHGPGVCPKCGEQGLRHKCEAPGAVVAGCDFCKEATLI